ncbi:putative short chain dehydrogenase/ reductase [Aspergillus pseudoustus]|uniref:Short chain dehydrogenase/ reductase n=1 Tax=Aspergillus pseudoustus TaxID=1810923 RepID=A0ABR4ITE0_9EURO
MPRYPAYKKGVVDCTTPPDLNNVQGKSVVITGGASGMGEQATRAFVAAGAFVTFGDVNETAGRKIEAQLGSNAQFVRCDVTDFESQRELFRRAEANSPSKTVDVAIANAGITGADSIFYGEESGEEPQAPDFKILDVNVNGVIGTCKLARYYFKQHELTPGRDRCFIVMSSAAGYGDVPGGPIYMMSKFAARALMRCIRRTTFLDGIRACALAPWYVDTNLMSPSVVQHAKSKGVKFADAADAAGAMLRIVSDPSVNGRCFTIVNREEAPLGYYDMDVDDYPDGSRADEQQNILLSTSQRIQVRPEDQ